MFFEFILLLIINHLLRLRTGWLNIEDWKLDEDWVSRWMKMGQLLGGDEVVDGC